MFAGPNGSGKSSLVNQIKQNFNIGYFINADLVESELKNNGYLDCKNYLSKDLVQADWDLFISKSDLSERIGEETFPEIRFRENILVLPQKHLVNSYHAAIICEFFRQQLLTLSKSFSFETVMSHPSKVDFLKEAKQQGFKTYLYFICTQDPEINVSRVQNRFIKGGHDVPIEKIKNRYFRSLDLLAEAFKLVDRAFVIDNSNKGENVIIEKDGKDIIIHTELLPAWIEQYLLSRLEFSE